jgi:hypothetical protein
MIREAAKVELHASVPSMGCHLLDETSQPMPMTVTVAKPQGEAGGNGWQMIGRRNTNGQ